MAHLKTKNSAKQSKDRIRNRLLKMRKNLPASRKKQAALEAFHRLKMWSVPTLSFAPLPTEINLWPINFHLLFHKNLFLPKVNGQTLDIYHITSLSLLGKSSKGILEPDPNTAEKVPLEKVAYILVPGIAFDPMKHRLGFGQGFYDRLLKDLSAQSIGIGFKEQQITRVPVEPHDQQLSDIYLF